MTFNDDDIVFDTVEHFNEAKSLGITISEEQGLCHIVENYKK